MTENEVLIKTPEEAIETIKSNMPTSGYQMLRESLDMAISALKEIQQYRKIGTVEEIKSAKKYIDLKKKCGTPANTIDLCAEYIAIGTVEECREAVEKQKPMKIKEIHVDEYFCPACGAENNCDQGVVGDKYCLMCGHAVYQDLE